MMSASTQSLRRFGARLLLAAGLFAGAACPALPTHGDSTTLYSVKDNTLYQYTTGSRSNGAGYAFFSGRVGSSGNGRICRAVMAFDFGSIPAGSVITSAKLTLSLFGSNTGPQVNTLHRLLNSWGEGSSIDDTGHGAPSQPNDATWIHRFYPGTLWSAAGGDFTATISASQTVGAELIPYSWESAGMVADIQNWLNNPSTNFGWLLKGNEAVIQTVKKFITHEAEDPFSKPRLEIEYTPPPSCPSDLNHDRVTGVPDLLEVINSWGPCPQPCAPFCYSDLAPDCSVNAADLLTVINNWGPCD